MGAVQAYGYSCDTIVASCTAERATGWIAWGQWRGWQRSTPWDLPGPVTGGGNTGAEPLLFMQFLDNRVLEGNNVINYNADWNDGSGGYACFMNGTSIAVTDTTHWLPDGNRTYFATAARADFPINSFIVIRRTAAASDGGVQVSHLAADVVVEYNTFTNSSSGVDIDGSCVRVLDRGNTITYG